MFMSRITELTTTAIGLLIALAALGCGAETGSVGSESGKLLPGGGVVSDDFNTGSLDTSLWQVVDPQGDGTVALVGAGTQDALLELSVPAGTSHDAWTNNTTLRVMQAATNDDFELEIKFESVPGSKYQSQGFIVEQDASNYIRYDVYHDGKSLRAFSATFTEGTPTVRVSQKISSGPVIYLRLSRSSNQWTASYSYDGTSWATATSFSHSLAVSSVGPFAGNFNPAPAYTAIVDYFIETSSPIDPEDPPLCDPSGALLLTTQAVSGTIVRSPDQLTYSCGDVVTLTAQPDVGATFLGWGGALSGSANPQSITINDDTTVIANFDLDTTAPQVSNVSVTTDQTSAAITWQTDELSTGLVEYGLTTAYELGSVSSNTLSTAHSVSLQGLVEGQTYHYRITVEDSFANSVVGSDATLTTDNAICVLTTHAENGTILRSPNQPSYDCGTAVTLTAQPAPGGTFLGWGGALSGLTNPETIVVVADTTVSASFSLDTTPPQISGVTATSGETSAIISWQTNEPTTGLVEYGLTPSYELGSVASGALATSHAVSISGLADGMIYHYRVTALDGLANASWTGDATFMTTPSGGGGTGGTGGGGPTPGAILSDDFYDGVLDESLWAIVDPVGDGTVGFAGAGTEDARLLLSVPSGTTHDAWTENTTLRVTQPAADEDLAIEVKFESVPAQRYQGQGLLVEEDPSNYVRLDFYSDGKSLRVFCATFENGSATVRENLKISSLVTPHLRLTRSGDQWTAEYSDDGSSWSTAASFNHSLAVTAVGVFASNFSPNPAYTAVVDYFFDVGSPISPEDSPSCSAGELFTLATSSTGPGLVDRTPDKPNYECGELVTLTAQSDPGADFLGWSGDASGTVNPLTVTIGGDTSIGADFDLDNVPPQVSGVSAVPTTGSATVSWQTDEVSTGYVEYGLTTSYELGSVASSSTSTSHGVTLLGLASAETYHFRITAADSLSNSITTGDSTFTTAAASANGPTIEVWYGESQTFGALGEAQQWVNVLGQVYDPDGLSVLTYSLNGGPAQSLSVGPFRRLAEPGDFNVELDFQELSPGLNTVAIRSVDGLGYETIKTVDVTYSAGNVWPSSFVADWSSAASISDVAQVVDGRWSIVGGELRNDLQRYDRAVAIGDVSWTDYEVTVPVTVHSINPDGFGGINGAPGVGVMLKWPGHSDWTGEQQPNWGYYPIGGGGWVEFAANGDGQLRLDDFTPGGVFKRDTQRVIGIGTTYIWKIRVESRQDNSTLYQLKVWPAGTSEPVGWDLAEAEQNDVPGGSMLLLAHFADVSFGNITISPLE